MLTTILGLSLFVALTLLLQRGAGIRLGVQPLIAALRAVIQLAAIAAVLHGVFTHPWTAALFLALMMTIASATSARRLSGLPYGTPAAIAGVVSGAGVVITLIFVLQVMDVTVSNVIAIGGIVTGNCMSAATLSGRNFRTQSMAQRGQIEGWLALGAKPPRAFRTVAQAAVREMCIPTIDQTKSTGLVTLPGAFVGALIGGASPVEAARFQLVVLVGIMLAQTITGLVTVGMLSRSPVVLREGV